MTTYTFNKSNWSGRQATIRVRKDGSFLFDDQNITLVERLSTVAGLHLSDVLADGRKVATVARWDNEKFWTATSEFSDLSRADEVAQVAAAKLLSNI